FTAVFGKIHGGAEGPNAQVIVGIDAYLAVVRRARIGVAHLVPSLALVFAAKDSALFVLHQRINNVGILTINIEPNAARFAAIFIGQALGEFFPGRATVGGFVDCRFGAASVVTERSAPAGVGGGVKRVWAFGIHGHVADARVVGNLEDLRPGFAGVASFVDAPFGIRAP